MPWDMYAILRAFREHRRDHRLEPSDEKFALNKAVAEIIALRKCLDEERRDAGLAAAQASDYAEFR